MTEVRAEVVPSGAFGTEFLPDRPEQRTAELLSLIDQEREHHVHGKDDGQMLLAMAIIVFIVVALVLERVECFLLNLPPCPVATNEEAGVVLGNLVVDDPREESSRLAVGSVLHVMKEVDEQIAYAEHARASNHERVKPRLTE
jgi:hypothetical protein